ncbi:MAG: hypothetical protein CFE39_12350 [Comamonadaceae bacterium PBBC2]|nr:MAG: hypothetical protein CFE39_12350 [Comamonadaceae bacterium PBBC2]
MTFKRYFSKDFPKDLLALQLTDVPQVLKDIFNDDDLCCFGGKDWSHVAKDLEAVPLHNRPQFVLSLLAVVLTDQCIQTHFKSSYKRWREQTNYPKFAWIRFGLYNENPLKILTRPESEGLLPVAATVALVPEFVQFFLELIGEYLQKHMPQVSAEQFFQKVFKDEIMDLQGGEVLDAFKQTLTLALNPQEAPALSSEWALVF